MVRKSEMNKIEKILNILMENSRIKFTHLAKQLGVTEGAIRKNIANLIRKGIIRKFTVDIDWKKVGLKTAFIGFDCKPEYFDRIIENIKKIKEVKRIYISSGDHQFIVFTIYKTGKEIKDVIKKIREIKGVKKVCPSIIVEEI